MGPDADRRAHRAHRLPAQPHPGPRAEEPRLTLVIQHIWSRWTKGARAAGAHRPRPKDAYRLPAAAGGQVLVHDLKMLEADEFALAERFVPAEGKAVANLIWRADGERYALTLNEPWSGMRATAWPEHLPRPLTVLEPGDAVIIDWNGRFRASMGGSNRSFFYEQHRFAIACVEAAPAADLFLELKPRKTFDFTTRIY